MRGRERWTDAQAGRGHRTHVQGGVVQPDLRPAGFGPDTGVVEGQLRGINRIRRDRD